MATAVIMPRQGQSVESCIITERAKKKGDTVAIGDVLFSYETDKSSFDEKSEAAGTLLEVFAAEGDDVPCLEVVCIIGDAGEDISALIPKKDEVPAPATGSLPATSLTQSSSPRLTVSSISSMKSSCLSRATLQRLIAATLSAWKEARRGINSHFTK